MVVREYLKYHTPHLSYLVNDKGVEIERVEDLTPYLDYECEVEYEEHNHGYDEDTGWSIIDKWEILHILPQPDLFEVLGKLKWNSIKKNI